MVFSSSIFIFLFLPITLILYYIAEKAGRIAWKNAVIFFCSVVFYAWGGLQFAILLLILTGINYAIALLMDGGRYRKIFLIIGIGIDILDLVYFKYTNFIIDNIQKLAGHLTGREVDFGIPQITLPIGISFFTFQIMSYLIDVYRRDVPVQKNIMNLGLYIMMFPQLIAGPIVRYSDVNREIENRTTSPEMVVEGLKRFIIGFAKKVFVANSMGSMADAVFALDGQVNTVYAWLGALAYTMQIFFDFSAYSDMAIGLGRIFGFHFNENFNYPYVSQSIREFWRRWHISLSTWFRDYVYIPLGGNRKGKGRTYLNNLVVFLLTGIWHGAAWQFVFWGLYHGAFILIERMGLGKVLGRLPKVFRHIYTMLIVVAGWVFFRADSIGKAFVYLKNMFLLNLGDFKNPGVLMQMSNLFILMSAVAIFASTPLPRRVGSMKLFQVKWVNMALYMLLWYVSVAYMVGLSYNPFIYFKF